jgi:hypothetical protein
MSRRPRILLLHPPGTPGRLYQLDGYCSQPQKGPFRWHPLDFVAFSSAWTATAEIVVRDLGSTVDTGRLPAEIDAADVVVGLIGAWGWPVQRRFWQRVIARGRPTYVSGDLARHEPAFVFASLPGLTGILPELATPPSVADLREAGGERMWRPGRGAWARPPVPRDFRLGRQPFDAWNHGLYKLPFTARRPWASVMTQVGCPHPCSYCILGDYAPAFRDVEDLRDDLANLRRAGARHLYVRDATLNSSPKHLGRVLPQLGATGLPWNAFGRLDGIGAHARDLRAAGCHTLQFGLESPQPERLAAWGKRWRGAPVAEELAAIRAAGIRTVGHFVLGLDEASSARDIVDFADAIGLDWATISPLMRRPGTDLWTSPPGPTDNLGLEDDAAQAAEVAAAMRRFYLQPRRLSRIGGRFLRDPGLALCSARGLWTRQIDEATTTS